MAELDPRLERYRARELRRAQREARTRDRDMERLRRKQERDVRREGRKSPARKRREAEKRIEELERDLAKSGARYEAYRGEAPELPQDRRSPLQFVIDVLSAGDYGQTRARAAYGENRAAGMGRLESFGRSVDDYFKGAWSGISDPQHREKQLEEYMRRDLGREQGDYVRKIPGIGEHLPTTLSEFGLWGHSLGNLGVFEDPELRKQRIDAMNIPDGAKSLLNWAAALRPNRGGLMDIDDVSTVAFINSVATDPLNTLTRGPKAVLKAGGNVFRLPLPTVREGGEIVTENIGVRLGKKGEELVPVSKKGKERLDQLADETAEKLRARDPETVKLAEDRGVRVLDDGKLQWAETGENLRRREILDMTSEMAEPRLLDEMGEDWMKSPLAAPRDLRIGIPFTPARIPISRPLRRVAGKVAETAAETRAWTWLSDQQRFSGKVIDLLSNSVPELFVPGIHLGELPGAKELFDMLRHTEENMAKKLIRQMATDKRLKRVGMLGTKKTQAAWRRIYQSIQNPEAGIKLTPEQQAGKEAFQEWIGVVEQLDNQFGTLSKAQQAPRQGRYVPLFLREKPSHVENAIAALGRTDRAKAPSDFYHHNIDAAFDSIEEVFEWNKALADRGIKELNPVLDGTEVLARRMTNLSRAASQKQLNAALRAQYGMDKGDIIARSFGDAARLLDGSEHAAVQQTAQAVLEGWRKLKQKEFLKRLGEVDPETQEEVLRRLLLDVKTVRDRDKFMDTYLGLLEGGKFGDVGPDLLPKLQVPIPPGHAIHDLGMEGKAFVVPQGLKDHFLGMETSAKKLEEMKPIVQAYERFLNMTKMALTLPFPAFHAVNVYSSMAMALSSMAGNWVKNPLRMMRNYSRMMNGSEELVEGLSRRGYTGSELKAAMENFGVNMDVDDVIQLTKLDTPVRRTSKTRRGLLKAAEYASTKHENAFRRMLFLDYVMAGRSPADAAAELRRVMFDYGDLAPAEKTVFRKIFPFYGWLRKSYARNWDLIVNEPHRLSLQLRPFRQWSEDREGMVSYRDGGLVMRTNRDGNTFEAIEGIKLAPLDFNTLDFGNFRKTFMNLLAMSAPPLTLGVEYAGQRNIRGDYPLYRDRYDALGKTIEAIRKQSPATAAKLDKWLGHRMDAVDGKYVHTFSPNALRLFNVLSMTSRLQSTSAQALMLDYSNPESREVATQMFLGAKSQVLNKRDEKIKRHEEGKREMGTLHLQQGIPQPPRGQR